MVIIESRLRCHILDLVIGGAEKFLGTFHSALLQIIGKTDLHLLLKEITQVSRIHSRRFRSVLQADGFLIITVYKFNGMAHSPGYAGGYRYFFISK